MKPLENRRVTGVASERYPLNKKCAHPECGQDTADPHHTWPRSSIGNSSWFVRITTETEVQLPGWPAPGISEATSEPIPHVTGLCRAHHEAVELHHSWIKLEEVGGARAPGAESPGRVFNWYDRQAPSDPQDELPPEWVEWRLIGSLNPQPGSVEGKPKRKKREKQPARKKAVYSTRIPKDEAENGYEVLDSLIDANRERLAEDMGWSASVPDYFVLVAVLAEGLQ